jgi:N-acetylmuramoyl-L-alanine amidase
MREIKHLVVHCSATPEGKHFTAADIDRWHKAQGWRMIGYHFVILLDGTIQIGRPIEQVGSHVAGHNAKSIGICLIGGMDAANKKPKDTYNAKQLEALHALLHDLKAQFPSAEVLGHRDFPGVNKACPSKDIRKWWNGGHGVKGNNL